MSLSRRQDAVHRRARRRSGFTLLEVITAIILIDAGLLALVAGSAILVRRMSEVRARTEALRVATNRLELLGISGCTDARGEAVLPDGMTERWSGAVQANAVRELRDTVTFTAAGATQSLVLRTRLSC